MAKLQHIFSPAQLFPGASQPWNCFQQWVEMSIWQKRYTGSEETLEWQRTWFLGKKLTEISSAKQDGDFPGSLSARFTITGFPRTSVLESCHSGVVSVMVRVYTRLPSAWETEVRSTCGFFTPLCLQVLLHTIFFKKQSFSSQKTFGQPDASLWFQLQLSKWTTFLIC